MAIRTFVTDVVSIKRVLGVREPRRRTMAFLLCVCCSLVAGAVLVGASAEASSKHRAAGPAAPARTTKATLTVWSYLSTASQQKMLRQLAVLFNKAYPNVKVKNVLVPFASFDTKLIAAAGTKAGPDVVVTNPVVDFTLLTKATAVADMSSYWNKFADRAKFAANTVWKAGNQTYSVQPYANLVALYYNADILNSLGISPPKTQAELGAALAAVAKDGRYTGLSIGLGNPLDAQWDAMPFFQSNGVSYCNLTNPAAGTTFSLLANWLKAGYIPTEADSWDQPAAFQKFLGGNVAFVLNGNWEISDAKTNAHFKFGVVRVPAGTAGSRVFLGGEAVGIGAFSRQKDLAWQYLKNSWFSRAAGAVIFSNTGSLPSRSDAAGPSVTNDPYAAPFASAVATPARWPNNPNGQAVLTHFGQVIGSLASGAIDASAAATQAADQVNSDLKSGGGRC